VGVSFDGQMFAQNLTRRDLESELLRLLEPALSGHAEVMTG